jgi:hypothetical protein
VYFEILLGISRANFFRDSWCLGNSHSAPGHAKCQFVIVRTALFQIAPTALLVIILSADLTLGVEKQVKLEDIERDNLRGKQAVQQPQVQQQIKSLQQPNIPDYTETEQLNYPAQQLPPAYQPQLQFQPPPTGGLVALYLPGSGLPGNYPGIVPDLTYVTSQHQGQQTGIVPDLTYVTSQHQGLQTGPRVYLNHGGYTGLQFVQAPPSPLIYSNQPVTSPQPYHVVHPLIHKGAPFVSAQVNPKTQHNPRVPQVVYQHARAPTTVNTEPNFVFISQQNYNPIPKELQSYTTIPREVYEGKEPDFVDDQQPSVSLTNDGFKQHNTLYQQPKPQRPVFSPGVKSNGPLSPKPFPSGGSFLVPTRLFPGIGVSFNSYRQSPGAF